MPSLAMRNPFKSSKPESANSSGSDAKDVAARGGQEFAEQMSEGRNLERVGKYDEARKTFERLIVTHPTRYEPYHRLGVVAARQKRFDEAQALYAQAIRLESKDANLFNDLGYCFYLQGRLEKAEAAMLKAVSLSPSNARYRNNLGLVYGHQGRHEEALAQFRHAGSESDAYYNLAFVLASREQTEEAKNCFRLALGADPSYEPARRALASFEQFEKAPDGLADMGPLVENGVRWVPYSEGDEADSGVVQTAMQRSSPSADRIVPSTRPSTQAQLHRARSFMSDRMDQTVLR
jgi:tetratricopeptide (TPR) repeat protein